jgi:hypothetical protein
MFYSRAGFNSKKLPGVNMYLFLAGGYRDK